jgi:hypothetical protein
VRCGGAYNPMPHWGSIPQLATKGQTLVAACSLPNERPPRKRRVGDRRKMTAADVYSASTIKLFRRNKAAVTSIRDAIHDLLEEDHPQTVRQIFYALTVRGLIKKAEIEYQQTVVRLLVQMREDGDIPFEWIADNTRWMRKPTTFVGLDACLKNTAKFYRRDLWAAMPVYCEVWCEKDALAGVLIEKTNLYDVPLMVARGYSSISFLHSAAETIEASPHTCTISATSIRAVWMPLAISRPNSAATPRPQKFISSARQSHASKSRRGTCRRGRRR